MRRRRSSSRNGSKLPSAAKKREKRVNAETVNHSSLSFSFLLFSSHLEAKHPELVRRGVQLRVQRRPELLLVEVLLVRVGQGRRVRLILGFFVGGQRKKGVSAKAFFPIRRSERALFPFICRPKETNHYACDAGGEQSERCRREKGQRGVQKGREFLLWRRKPQLSRHGSSLFSLLLLLLRKRTHAAPPPLPTSPLEFHAEDEYGELYPCIFSNAREERERE